MKEKATMRPKRKAGRKKEREQISVRIDRAAMDLAYAEIKRTGVHISDLLERALLLALREGGCEITQPHATARIHLYDQSVEHAERVIALAVLETFGEERTRSLTQTERFFVDFVLEHIDDVRQWPNADEVMLMLAQEHPVDIARRGKDSE